MSKFDPGVITAPGVVALRRSCSYILDSPGTGPPGAVPEALSLGVWGCVWVGGPPPPAFCGWWPKTILLHLETFKVQKTFCTLPDEALLGPSLLEPPWWGNWPTPKAGSSWPWLWVRPTLKSKMKPFSNFQSLKIMSVQTNVKSFGRNFLKFWDFLYFWWNHFFMILT